LYKNSSQKIIYIGKAKQLKKRVSSYFSKSHDDLKTQELVKQIVSVDVIITDSEAEALLLESKLIKQYKPKYNIELRDTDRYAYLKLTEDEFPRLVTARRKTSGGEYFGPFVSGYNRVLTLKTLNQVFGLKTCKGAVTKPCFNYHIGLCSCPTAVGMSHAEYNTRVANVRRCLKGNVSDVVAQLQTQMKQYALKQKFELAKQTRDQIAALDSLQDRQKVDLDKSYDQDVIGFASDGSRVVYFVFNIVKGTMHKREQFEISIPEYQTIFDVHESFVAQYYDDRVAPKSILLSDGFLSDSQQKLLSQALSKNTPYTVSFSIPKRGDNVSLVQLAITNAEYQLAGEMPELLQLKEFLKLPTVPFNMECYDISNLRDSHIVGAKVHFTYGKPNKDLYRKYKIRWTDTQNDFASLYEVLKRRFRHAVSGDEPLPDLIVIDGGKGQLGAAIQAMKESNVFVPMISLAKREEEIYFPGKSRPINTKKNKARHQGVRLLQAIRDETHRFVISYHRKLRDSL
jgi:excinuclease ABC subunit C